ncbi:NAD(P)-binding domain-containing protein [Solibacillus sp.]|uniref:NADPH-dependent F420 reductase n=1 Tax=Solibacillus sp. TaxID=1909654 RepID=UPI003315A667
MKFGIIGAGPIGQSIAKKLMNNGHEVKVADARGMERLAGKAIVGTAVSTEEIGQHIDVLIISIPLYAIPTIQPILKTVGDNVIVVDTSNYYPFRDQQIEAIDQGMVESAWVTEQLGRPVIKAFSNLLAFTLENKGTPAGTTGRIAMAVAGDDEGHKQIIMNLVNECGFDTVDAGSIAASWNMQPGTPAYCTELTKEELTAALQKAEKGNAAGLRDEIMAQFSMAFTHDDIIALNRKVFGALK